MRWYSARRDEDNKVWAVEFILNKSYLVRLQFATDGSPKKISVSIRKDFSKK